MKIRVNNASWSVQTEEIIHSVDLLAKSGEFIGLVGPNGSGKSSLLRLIYRLYPPQAGVVYLNNYDIWKINSKEVAKNMAVVAQERGGEFDLTSEEMVFLGRNPHKGLLEGDTTDDYKIVHIVLKRVSMSNRAKQSFHTLSGGEKQRVLIARSLAQQAKALILDEPTNHLDIRYQLEILELIRSLKITVIAALHDLNLAAAYCDRLYLLQAGRIIAQGIPSEVLTAKLIQSTYGVKTKVEVNPSNKKLHIKFLGLLTKRKV